MLYFDAPVPVRSGPSGGNTAGPGGGLARFSVDPDQAQKMIKGLEEAVRELAKLKREAVNLAQSGAPGPDPYSGWVTLAMRKAAGQEAGGYSWANDEAQKALEETIRRIKASLAKYRGTDDDAKQALS